MGKLIPEESYTYQTIDNATYSINPVTKERVLIGYAYKKKTLEKEQDDILWEDIRTVAKTNNALHAALERVIILYRLTKDDPL